MIRWAPGSFAAVSTCGTDSVACPARFCRLWASTFTSVAWAGVPSTSSSNSTFATPKSSLATNATGTVSVGRTASSALGEVIAICGFWSGCTVIGRAWSSRLARLNSFTSLIAYWPLLARTISAAYCRSAVFLSGHVPRLGLGAG